MSAYVPCNYSGCTEPAPISGGLCHDCQKLRDAEICAWIAHALATPEATAHRESFDVVHGEHDDSEAAHLEGKEYFAPGRRKSVGQVGVAGMVTRRLIVMKEAPILFSGGMVRAILGGKKTQTRRVIKPQPDHSETGKAFTLGRSGLQTASRGMEQAQLVETHCPYGNPGDRLWVRETWARHCDVSGYDCIAYRAGGALALLSDDNGDGDPVGIDKPVEIGEIGPPLWRPSIHMPRWASRLTFEITGVRVERVQDITAADALAEGVLRDDRQLRETPNFRQLWDSINEKRGYGWETNPWVFVIEFKKL